MKNIITDLDGTLALELPRRHYIESHGWKEYFAHIHEDLPNLSVANMLRDLIAHDYTVYIFTSRPEQYRKETIEWLHKHELHGIEFLEMRPDKDTNLGTGDWQATRTDEEIKLAMLEKYGLNRTNTLMVLEDRDAMVNFYRNLGFNCWQVHHEGQMFVGR